MIDYDWLILILNATFGYLVVLVFIAVGSWKSMTFSKNTDHPSQLQNKSRLLYHMQNTSYYNWTLRKLVFHSKSVCFIICWVEDKISHSKCEIKRLMHILNFYLKWLLSIFKLNMWNTSGICKYYVIIMFHLIFILNTSPHLVIFLSNDFE